MPNIAFGLRTTGDLGDALSSIPDDLKDFLRNGFSLLANADARSWPRIFDVGRLAGVSPSNLDLDTTGIPSEEAFPIVNAARLLLGALAFRGESPEQFLEQANQHGLVEKTDNAQVLRFVHAHAMDREALRRSLEANELQYSLLPSLTRLDFKIDVRLEFDIAESAAVRTAAPVVLVHVDTDASDGELWFQMTPLQIDALAEKLSLLRARIQTASVRAQGLCR